MKLHSRCAPSPRCQIRPSWCRIWSSCFQIFILTCFVRSSTHVAASVALTARGGTLAVLPLGVAPSARAVSGGLTTPNSRVRWHAWLADGGGSAPTARSGVCFNGSSFPCPRHLLAFRTRPHRHRRLWASVRSSTWASPLVAGRTGSPRHPWLPPEPTRHQTPLLRRLHVFKALPPTPTTIAGSRALVGA